MTAATAIREAIEAPVTATPYPYGLFSVLPGAAPVDTHWGFGVTWNSDICSASGAVRVLDDAVCATTDDVWAGEDYCVTGTADPFVVYAFSDRGSQAYSGSRDQQLASANTRFTAGEQAAVEVMLRKRLAAAVPSPTAVAITGWVGIDKVKAGLAYVEQALSEALGYQGVIVMDRFTASLLNLPSSGSRLVTDLGTPVAAIQAGTTSPPTGAYTLPTTVTIYGTGPMFLYRGALDTQQVDNRAINNFQTIVSRPYLVGWDCAAVAATVTL